MNENENEGQPAGTGLTLVRTSDDDYQSPTQTSDAASDSDSTLAERFESFHAANPAVYETLVKLARSWVRGTGRHRLGIASLYERTRWELSLQTNDPDYKINNDFKAFYSRLIMLNEPDLQDLFEVRRSAADSWLSSRAA